MKKISLITLVVIVVIAALFGCGDKSNEKASGTSQNTANKENISREETALIGDVAGSTMQESTELAEEESGSEGESNKLDESTNQNVSQKNKEAKSLDTTKKGQQTTSKKQQNTTKKSVTTKTEETTTKYIEPHLNKTDVVYYRGGSVWSGIAYDYCDYTDYTQEFFELYVYGVDRKDVKWSSANTNIAQVADGKVIVYDKGKTVITAEVNGKVFKCNLDVRVVCPYFYIVYSYVVNDEILSYYGRKDHWIWYDWYQMNVGDTVKYKITEREYNERGELIKETDITKKLDLKPNVDNVFKIDKNNGTITALRATDWREGSKEMFAVLSTSECFRDQYDEAGEDKPLDDIYFVQRLKLMFDVCEKGIYDSELEITMEGMWGTKFFALQDFDCAGIFTWDDEFIEDTTWYYYSTGLNEFTWTSSNTSVIKIGEPMGSGHILYGAVRYEIIGPGTTTITVKRGNKVVDSVEVIVDNNLNWTVVR